jgi:hypothetical protein
MFAKYLSLVLVASLAYVANTAPAFAQSTVGNEAQLAEKVKEGILKLGDGPEAVVRVKLRDRTRLAGYIDEAGADSFTVIDELTGTAATVSYSQAKQIMGVNGLTGVSMAVGVGIRFRLALRCYKGRKPPTILQKVVSKFQAEMSSTAPSSKKLTWPLLPSA